MCLLHPHLQTFLFLAPQVANIDRFCVHMHMTEVLWEYDGQDLIFYWQPGLVSIAKCKISNIVANCITCGLWSKLIVQSTVYLFLYTILNVLIPCHKVPGIEYICKTEFIL